MLSDLIFYFIENVYFCTYLKKIMSRIKIIFVLILILLGICADLMSQPPQNEDYILVINSYSENSPWSYNCTVPIYETLIKEYEELTAYTEHRVKRNYLCLRRIFLKSINLLLVWSCCWEIQRSLYCLIS